MKDRSGFFASLKFNGYILKGPCSAKLIIDRDENKTRPLIKDSEQFNVSLGLRDGGIVLKMNQKHCLPNFVIFKIYLFVIYLFENTVNSLQGGHALTVRLREVSALEGDEVND